MPKDAKVHFKLKSITPYTQELTWSVCGLYSIRSSERLHNHMITDDLSMVNCKNCKRTDKYKEAAKQWKES